MLELGILKFEVSAAKLRPCIVAAAFATRKSCALSVSPALPAVWEAHAPRVRAEAPSPPQTFHFEVLLIFFARRLSYGRPCAAAFATRKNCAPSVSHGSLESMKPDAAPLPDRLWPRRSCFRKSFAIES